MNNKLPPPLFQCWQKILFGMVVCAVGAQAGATLSQQSTDDVLTPEEWKRVDESVDRALLWLASNQQRNGSFPTLPQGQPGVTSLCVMAFLAHGHLPGEGQYGLQLEKAIAYIQSCQKQNGLLGVIAPNGQEIIRDVNHAVGTTTAYNHAISGLLLSEAFSVTGQPDAKHSKTVIENALKASLIMQGWQMQDKEDRGGWRYLYRSDGYDSDLSITGWELMFLRSAKNAGFDVGTEPIDEAIKYVRRCFLDDHGTFSYGVNRADRQRPRAMAGAGILALAHAGYHNSPEAQRAGKWLLEHHFQAYNQIDQVKGGRSDRYHYGLFTCCQAMYQLGGPRWQEFFPPTVKTLLAIQQTNGSWFPETPKKILSMAMPTRQRW